MTNKEYIKEHLKSLRKDFDVAIKNNLKDYANKLVEEIKCSENILKDLEVLEILKKKNVYMFRINNCINAEEYNEWVGINVDDELTEEEFNLIKGVVR